MRNFDIFMKNIVCSSRKNCISQVLWLNFPSPRPKSLICLYPSYQKLCETHQISVVCTHLSFLITKRAEVLKRLGWDYFWIIFLIICDLRLVQFHFSIVRSVTSNLFQSFSHYLEGIVMEFQFYYESFSFL